MSRRDKENQPPPPPLRPKPLIIFNKESIPDKLKPRVLNIRNTNRDPDYSPRRNWQREWSASVRNSQTDSLPNVSSQQFSGSSREFPIPDLYDITSPVQTSSQASRVTRRPGPTRSLVDYENSQACDNLSDDDVPMTEDSTSVDTSQTVLPPSDSAVGQESQDTPVNKQKNRFKVTRDKRGFTETFVKPGFTLKGAYGKFYYYVGHNKAREEKFVLESSKIGSSRPSRIKAGFLVKCKQCKQTVRAADGCENRLQPHMESHGFVFQDTGVSNNRRKKPHKVVVQKYGRNDIPQHNFNRAMMKYIIQSGIPFNTVLCPAFKELISSLDVRVTVYTSKSYLQTLKKVIRQEIEPNLYKLLQGANEIGLIIDSWTNRTNQAVFCVQAVFMDKDCNLVQKTIAATHLQGSHSHEKIRKILMQIIKKFGIEKKVTYIIGDKGGNMQKAIFLKGTPEFCLVHPDFENARCFAHCIHNIMIKALNASKRCQKLIDRVGKQIQFIRRGQDTAKDLKKLAKKSFIRPVKTRWTSYYKMLERFMEENILDATRRIIVDRRTKYVFGKPKYKRKPPTPFTEMEIDILREMLKVMKPVAEVTDILQGDTYRPTDAMAYITQCHSSLLNLDIYQDETIELKRNLSRLLTLDVEEALNTKSLIVLMVLNPRWKAKFFNIYHESFPNDPYQLPSMDLAIRVVRGLLSAHETPRASGSQSNSEQDFCADFYRRLMEDEEIEPEYNELDRYLSSNHKNCFNIENDNYVRDFWVSRQNEYPTLFKLFKKYFIRRVSTASVERSFNKLTKLNDKYRPYKIETLGDILMLFENLSILSEDDSVLDELRDLRKLMPEEEVLQESEDEELKELPDIDTTAVDKEISDESDASGYSSESSNGYEFEKSVQSENRRRERRRRRRLGIISQGFDFRSGMGSITGSAAMAQVLESSDERMEEMDV